MEDERRGSNIMLTADESFRNVKLSHVGNLDQPTHGFSTFKFIPDTQESVIVALKSEEFQGKIASYLMVFKRDGTILMPEEYIGDHKFEGFEFL